MKKEYPVRFIFFSRRKGERFEEILGFAKKVFSVREISIHSEVKGLAEAIREPGLEPRIILILAASPDDLILILPYRDLFENQSVILILPDSEKSTMERALSLYPRYIDYIQNDPEGMFQVLKKMVKKLYGPADVKKNHSPNHNPSRRKQHGKRD